MTINPHAFSSAQHDAAELAGFVALLTRCPTDTDRKLLIMEAYDRGAIELDETTLLISALMVEAA